MANAEPSPASTAPAPAAGKKRHIRRIGRIFRWCIILCLPAAVIALVLPALVERSVNGILQSFTESGRCAVEVKRLDLWGCDCTVRAWADGRREPLSEIETISLRYSPLQLIFARRIDAVVVRGVRVPVELMEREIRFPVLEILKKTAAPAPASSADGKKPFRFQDLPISVRRAELRGVVLVKASDGGTAALPFGAELSCPQGNWSRMDFQLALGSGKNRFALRGKAAGEPLSITGQWEGRFDSGDLPGALRKFVPGATWAVLAGTGGFDAALDLAQGRIASLETFGTAHVDVSNAGCRVTGDPRWRMTWDGTRFRADCAGLETAWAGRQLKLEPSFLAMDCAEQSGEGVMVFSMAAKRAELHLTWRRTPEKAWQCQLRLDPREIKGLPEAAVTGSYGDDGRFAVRVAGKRLGYALPSLTLDAAELAVQGEGTWSDASYQAELKTLRVAGTGDGYIFTLPELSASGRWRDGKATGSIRAANGVFAMPAAQLTIRELAWEQPWRWPLEQSPEGALSAGAILWQDKVLGKAAAKTKPGNLALSVDGTVELCRLAGNFRAATAFGSAGFTLDSAFRIPVQEMRDNLRLRQLFPGQLGDLELSGKAAAEGTFTMADGGMHGQCALHLSDVRAASAEKDWEVAGMAADFAMPFLPELRSGGQQRVRCKTLRYGSIHTDALYASFRMDAPTSWCLEKLILKWCGGTVRAEYLQFDPASKVIPLTVHCDRLDLVRFLIQLGAGKGSGAGRVSGTLPVIYSKDHGFRTGDGFLYTTPGEDGKIAMEFSDAVKETQQGNTVFDMAQAALRNFSYSWAKIHMVTRGELLQLTMQLNGKPEQPLYFTYADGGIVKTDVPHLFQGIMLDLNLSLPLKDIFELVKRF